MKVKEALETLRETIEAQLCPSKSGLNFGLCDSAPECTCKSCWMTAIELYLRGEIECGDVVEGH